VHQVNTLKRQLQKLGATGGVQCTKIDDKKNTYLIGGFDYFPSNWITSQLVIIRINNDSNKAQENMANVECRNVQQYSAVNKSNSRCGDTACIMSHSFASRNVLAAENL
jgi:uncharacterized membrane-anchored protein